jgi:hypothetical protein
MQSPVKGLRYWKALKGSREKESRLDCLLMVYAVDDDRERLKSCRCYMSICICTRHRFLRVHLCMVLFLFLKAHCRRDACPVAYLECQRQGRRPRPHSTDTAIQDPHLRRRLPQLIRTNLAVFPLCQIRRRVDPKAVDPSSMQAKAA